MKNSIYDPEGALPRISIIVGHYGTGKTEFSVNFAMSLARNGMNVMLADLDIVNPYFRSREKKSQMNDVGIRVISSSQSCSDADVPSLPAELMAIFDDKSIRGVLDVGGDPVGARVLARFQPKITANSYELIYIVNANRPEVRACESALKYLHDIERTCGLTCSGLVNNTHLCGETTVEEIVKGAELADEISKATGIPVICHTAVKSLLEELPELSAPVYPIDINMKKPWEM